MAHAKLSPSGAHRWMACPGSAVLEADYPDRGSAYAREGTVAHELAAGALSAGWLLSDFVGEQWHGEDGDEKWSVPITQDMVDYVNDYVKLVREKAEGKTLMVERSVPIGHVTGEVGAYGTSDAIIIDTEQKAIEVIDLKYGMGVQVFAEDNEQAQLYALGALEEYGIVGDFSRITMTIHQPRLNHVAEWTIPVSQLVEFRDRASAAASACRAAEAFAPDVPEAEWSSRYLNPGEKQCRFCKAKATCPALRAEVGGIVHDAATLDDFADLLPHTPDSQTGDNYLSIAMSKVGLVEDWCKAIRAEVERRLLAGQTVEGYKLVEGKRGNRKWASTDSVEALFKSFRLRQDEMYDFSLISPTKAEKVFKDNPKRWAKVQEHITRAEGKPSVAPVTDKRPAMDVQLVADDFRDLLN